MTKINIIVGNTSSNMKIVQNKILKITKWLTEWTIE